MMMIMMLVELDFDQQTVNLFVLSIFNLHEKTYFFYEEAYFSFGHMLLSYGAYCICYLIMNIN